MSKYLFTSDLHIDKGIVTSISIDYLDFLREYCLANNIRHLIFGGDVFEKSTKIKHESFVPLFFKLMSLKESNILLYFILGNHDIINNDNDSIVETFAPFGTIIKNNATLNLDGTKIDFLSYTKDLTKIPNASDILLTHLSIADFQFDNGYEADQKNGMPVEEFDRYKLVLTGHFHRHQVKKNIVYGGSPYQLSFGEEGQTKGFIVFDDKANWEFVPYKEAPTYLTINVEDFTKFDYTNKFVQVTISRKVENFVKLKHLLYDRGALDVRPLYKKEEVEEDILNGIDIDLNGSVTTIIKQYLSELNIDGINNNKLVKLFDKIVSEAK